MHNNYFFLRVLVEELRRKLMYSRLKQCFSQDKDELMMGFERQNGDEFWIKCALGSQFSCLQFPETFHRAGRNSIDLFSDLLVAEVQAVDMFENERAFAIHFLGDFVLVFKLYGNRGNLILYRDGTYQSQFQKRLKLDVHLKLEEINRKMDQSFESFEASDSEVYTVFPTLGKEVKMWLDQKGYEDMGTKARWDLIQNMLSLLEEPSFFITESTKGVHLSLFPTGNAILFETEDPILALNKLYSYHWSVGEFNREKAQIEAAISKKLIQTEHYLDDLRNQRVQRDSNAAHEEIGNILMANLHMIPKAVKQVTLFDFYRDCPIVIKLNSSLSAAQNAENYYRKSKSFAKELAYWQASLDRKMTEYALLQRHLSEVQQVKIKKELKPYLIYLKQGDLVKKTSSEIPFKEFTVDGWNIWVGKSAKNNDLLTLKYAKKFDLWLHARDVAGSHVIIRNPNQKPVPKHVIEVAGGLAAYFSKRQSESLCPVIVTPKKYVRKTKDLLPGQVIVDREENVILVRPTLID